MGGVPINNSSVEHCDDSKKESFLPLFLRHDMVFVMGVAQGECSKQTKNWSTRMRGWNQNMSLLWHVCHRQLSSSDHFVMTYEPCKGRHERASGCTFTKRANGRS